MSGSGKCFGTRWVPTLGCAAVLATLSACLVAPLAARAGITQVVDATGDGIGGTLDSPRALAVDAAGNAYVAGSGSDNVLRITPAGVVTEIIDASGDGTHPLDVPNAVAVDGSGNVYVTGWQSQNAFRIATPDTCSTGGTPCAISEIIDSLGGPGMQALAYPYGVAADTAGNVYVTGSASNNVFRIATPGGCNTTTSLCTISEIIDAAGDGANPLTTPQGIATDPAANVYVAGLASDNVFRIATPGACSTTTSLCAISEIIDSAGDGANPLSLPYGVAADAAGNVFVSGYSSQNAFRVAAPGTCSTGGTPCQISEIIDASGDGSAIFGGGSDIVVDSAGDVYVAGENHDNAFRVAAPGTCSTGGTPCQISLLIDGSGDGVDPLDNATGIGVDAVGGVYVSGWLSDNAFRITPSVPSVPALPSGLGSALLAAVLGSGALRLRRFRTRR